MWASSWLIAAVAVLAILQVPQRTHQPWYQAQYTIPLLGMKKHLNRIAHGNLDVLDLERDELLAQMSEDLKEGGLAWKEKRKPVFRGV